MKREKIRELTMQVVFQMDVTGDFNYEDVSVISENKPIMKNERVISFLGIIRDHIKDIDRIILENIDSWKIDRLAKADLAILRVAVGEMFFCDDIPESVSINEAVELAKKYGDEKSSAFVNAVLGKISRNRSSYE